MAAFLHTVFPNKFLMKRLYFDYHFSIVGSLWFRLTISSSSSSSSSSATIDSMMTSSNRNIFRVTGHLCRSPVNSPHKGQWRGAFMFSLMCAWINRWANNREARDLSRYCAHHDVIVMQVFVWCCQATNHYLSRCGPNELKHYWSTRAR